MSERRIGRAHGRVGEARRQAPPLGRGEERRGGGRRRAAPRARPARRGRRARAGPGRPPGGAVARPRGCPAGVSGGRPGGGVVVERVTGPGSPPRRVRRVLHGPATKAAKPRAAGVVAEAAPAGTSSVVFCSAGISTPRTLPRGGHDVRVVDDRGIRLAERDLRQGRRDVDLAGDDVGADTRLRQHLVGGLPAGDALGAEDDVDVRLRQVGEGGHRPRVVGRGGDLEGVPGDGRRARRAHVAELVEGRGARGREEVGVRALGDLLGQRRARAEAEPDRRPGVRGLVGLAPGR